MRIKTRIFALALAVCFVSALFPASLGAMSASTGRVGIYPFTTDGSLTENTRFACSVEGQKVQAYAVKVNNTRTYETSNQDAAGRNRHTIGVAMFDMEGTVTMRVAVSVGASTARVLPVAAGINVTKSGNEFVFSIPKPGQYSVEFDGNTDEVLLVFASPFMDAAQQALANNADKVFEAGMHDLGSGENEASWEHSYHPNPDSVVYIKPGAVLRSRLFFYPSQWWQYDNVKVIGRGILDASHEGSWQSGGTQGPAIEMMDAQNILIDGISIFDPTTWVVEVNSSRNITLNNIKIISSFCNNDGITIQGSENITVTNSFVRAWDDCIVVKNYAEKFSERNADGTPNYANKKELHSNHITVKNCVLWSDLAQGLEIGAETNAGGWANPKISEIYYEDVFVVHAFHKAPISIHNCDDTDIFNITYKNIHVDDAQMAADTRYSVNDGWNYLIDFTSMTGTEMGGAGAWTHHAGAGKIHAVTLDGIYVNGGNLPGARFGVNAVSSMYDVAVNNVYYMGEPLDLSQYAKNGVTVSFANGSKPITTSTPTPTPTEAPTPTPTPTPTEAPTPTPTPTEEPTPTPTPTEAPSESPSPTVVPTEPSYTSPSPTVIPTNPQNPSPTPTVIPTNPQNPSPTPTVIPTNPQNPSPTPTVIPTNPQNPSPTPTVIPTNPQNPSPTPTVIPTNPQKPSPTPTVIPTNPQKPSPTPTVIPTNPQNPSPTPIPSATVTVSPSATPIPFDSPAPSNGGSPDPTDPPPSVDPSPDASSDLPPSDHPSRPDPSPSDGQALNSPEPSDNQVLPSQPPGADPAPSEKKPPTPPPAPPTPTIAPTLPPAPPTPTVAPSTPVGGVASPTPTPGKQTPPSATKTTKTIKLDPIAGAVFSKTVTVGKKIGALKTPKRKKYKFLGWFTKKSGGSQIKASTIYKTSITKLYAHWKKLK